MVTTSKTSPPSANKTQTSAKKKRTNLSKKRRKLNSYQLFVKVKMSELKEEEPDGKERKKRVDQLWKAEKEKNGSSP